MKIKLLVIYFFLITTCFSQINKPLIQKPVSILNAAKKTDIFTVNRVNIQMALNTTDTTLFPLITQVNPLPKREFFHYEAFEKFKDTARLLYTQEKIDFMPQVPAPIKIAHGFDANNGDYSAPLDNNIGCSGEDRLISVSNSFIEYYENNELKYRSDLSSFINYELPSPCDPKILFDPIANKFILFIQRCDGAYNRSEILIAFSKTDNPIDGWNFYKLSGNPLNKSNHWFDYPKMGITQDGLFISGNIFIGSNAFAQTVVYQIDKNLGFNGQPIKYRVWYDIADSPMTLMPVSYAYDKTYAKGIYLISTTWQPKADYIKLYDITGDIYDSNASLNFYKVPTTPYDFFAKAVQINQKIDNGDIRIQDALLNGNKIYYVFTSGNERNFSRINFNILDLPTLQNKSILLGDKPNYSYSYPSLHFFSQENESPTVVIQYNSSSNQSFPDIKCKTSDDNFNCSQEIVVKAGESIINNYDRWGDYSGITKNQARRSNLWLSSSYGKNQRRQTFITNIIGFNQPNIPADSILFKQLHATKSLDFDLQTSSEIKVVLKNNNIETTIFDGKAEKGKNSFEIHTEELKKGDYKLEVINKNSNKKLNEISFKTE